MKWSGLLCSLMAHAATATPALVWRTNSEMSVPVHTSGDIAVESLFVDSSDLQFIFVIGRQADGSETLSSWTAEGALPRVAEAAGLASAIHHSVSNVQSAAALTQFAKAFDKTAIQVNLEEFHRKLEQTLELQVAADGQVLSKTTHKANKRSMALDAATTVIVDIPASTVPAAVDKAITEALSKSSNVVLTAVRSVQEVKMERSRLAQERVSRMAQANTILSGRRRLEDAQNNVNQERENQQDMAGIYYVSMTPNILAGLLFFFLFTFITYIGVTCMGMIAGQDVYVKKMPAIGREA